MQSLTDLLKELNVPIAPEDHHHRTPGREQIDCPWCSRDSHKWRLGVALSGRWASCWSCGPVNVVETLADTTDLSQKQIRKLLGGVEYVSIVPRDKQRGKLVLPYGIDNMLPAHRKYLRGRGFDPDEIATVWDVKGIGNEALYAWRLFIPITCQGETLSWTTRSLFDRGVRYINAKPDQEVISAKHLLYGLDNVQGKAIIVHEGPTDAWRTGPGAVATMGLSYSKQQVLLLSQFDRRVICFDNEVRAQRRARKLCDLLSVFPGETFKVTLDAKDAGSAKEKEIRELRRRFLQ